MSKEAKRKALAAGGDQDLYAKLPRFMHVQLGLPQPERASEDELRAVVSDLVATSEANVEGVLQSKLEGKVVLLDNTRDSGKRKESTENKDATTSSQTLVRRKDKGKQGFFDVPASARSYETFMPLHELWKQYMQSILSYQDEQRASIPAMQQALVKADLHGCLLVVVKSKRPTLVGQGGIVIQETENTFRIITPANCIKVLPKLDSIFSFQLGKYTFSIFGNHFRIKPVERITRKFKSKQTIDL
eukprot:m.104424 g.104424  ORF g.104424 m.104424 type:complete len:245 (-) comp15077_c0_seq2:86-820(-)